MRTKTLLLTAACIAAGLATSLAQNNVYSLNVVGYVNKTITGTTAGYLTAVANPLDAPTNTLGALVPTAPDGTLFFKWNGAGFDAATFAFGSWDYAGKPEFTLAPGEGGFFQAYETFTVTFVGTVLEGALKVPYNAGYSMVASKVPQTNDVTSLGLTAPPLQDGDQLLRWNLTKQGYDTYTLLFGAWDPAVPGADIAESFILNTTAAGSWDRTFAVPRP
jgi:hypothetical protein